MNITTGPGALFMDGEGGEWRPVGWTTGTSVRFLGHDLEDPDALLDWTTPRPLTTTITLDVSGATAGMRRILSWFGTLTSQPIRLCIDGRAYRRRTRRRRR